MRIATSAATTLPPNVRELQVSTAGSSSSLLNCQNCANCCSGGFLRKPRTRYFEPSESASIISIFSATKNLITVRSSIGTSILCTASEARGGLGSKSDTSTTKRSVTQKSLGN